MVDTKGIGRLHFQVKTDVRETGIKEILDKEKQEKKRNIATGCEVCGNLG